MNDKPHAVILLAAGGSRRLGRPKQLLEYQGSSLLEHALNCVLPLNLPVFVVLGAAAELIRPLAIQDGVEICENPLWEQGISTSIKNGLDCARAGTPHLKGVLMVLADQPCISIDHLKQIIKLGQEGTDLVATAYQGTFGVPAYFSDKYFEDLKNLKGDQGAKQVLAANKRKVRSIYFPQAAIDLDTESDWQKFLNQRNKS